MAKVKKENPENELIEVETVPTRFSEFLKGRKLYHIKSEPNQTQEPKIEGYVYCGTGDGGFYYTEV